MTTTIIIDGSIKSSCMLGFELQSLHVIERRYKCSETFLKFLELDNELEFSLFN